MDIVIISIIVLSLIGAISGILLAYASFKFSVVSDPRVDEILSLLPRANCGACGYPSCIALAEAIVSGRADANACKVGGETTAHQIADKLGQGKVDLKERLVAHVFCGGSDDKCSKKFKYNGITDCDAALLVAGGDKNCSYGCLGYGTCVKACTFDAMKMGQDGLPIIDREKCVACGKCIVSCPRKIISYIPKSAKVAIDCVSHDKGASVKKICSVGCIKCRLCEKTCVPGAIYFKEDLPVIDYSKCDKMLGCMKVCPTGTIVELN
jgi:Na+-translocating ferredoxin:NAD+ oxidoreductase subunit B